MTAAREPTADEPDGSARVRLRPPTASDLGWLAEMDSDPVAVGEHNWGGEPQSKNALAAKLRATFKHDGLIGEQRGTLIVELDAATPIGTVTWRTERWGPSEASSCPAFGIALLPEFRGHGYGTAAQSLLIDYLFEHSSTNRVQSDTAADNPAEQRSLRKAGMVEEGVVRQAEFRAGKYHDHTLFSILRSEWESGQRSNPL